MRFPRPFLATASVALALCAAPLQAFDISDMTGAEREAFNDAVRAYLMENPQVIIEAVNSLEARQAEAQAAADTQMVAAQADALFDDGYSWVGGNPNGDVTIVEFLDYRCSFCRRAHPELEELIASDGNIRFIIKEFPILGEASTVSSRFAMATLRVAGDAAYKNVHDALITFNGEPTEAALRRIAEALELDADAIFAEMDHPEIDDRLVRNRALAQTLQITGTPTFVMGDQLVRGYVPLDGMREIVAEERTDG